MRLDAGRIYIGLQNNIVDYLKYGKYNCHFYNYGIHR